MNWNEKELRKRQQQGTIAGYTIISNRAQTNKLVISNQKPSKGKEWLSRNLMYWANENCLTLEEELRFDEDRKWRFDWAFAAIKIAVEYEGIFSKKSRHTTVQGYSGDVEKYNRAQELGWTIIRVTAMNYTSVLKSLNKILKGKYESENRRKESM